MHALSGPPDLLALFFKTLLFPPGVAVWSSYSPDRLFPRPPNAISPLLLIKHSSPLSPVFRRSRLSKSAQVLYFDLPLFLRF